MTLSWESSQLVSITSACMYSRAFPHKGKEKPVSTIYMLRWEKPGTHSLITTWGQMPGGSCACELECIERKLCQPSLPLGFMESSFLGRGIQLEEGQNRASNLEA